MNEDTMKGTATNVGGKVESAVGNATGNSGMQKDGMIDQAVGTAQDMYGQVKDAVRAALDEATPRVREASNAAVDTVKSAPIATAVAIGALGYLISWAVHASGNSANRDRDRNTKR